MAPGTSSMGRKSVAEVRPIVTPGNGSRFGVGLLVAALLGILAGAPEARAQSPTLVWLTGFEHGGISTQGGGLFNSQNATPEIVSAALRSGGYGLRISAASEFEFVRRTFPASSYKVLRFYVRFASLPGSNVDLLRVYATTGQHPGLAFNATTGRLRAVFTIAAAQDASTTVSAGAWYRVDMRVFTDAVPRTIEWQIDGVDQPTLSYNDAGGAGQLTDLSIGTQGVATVACDYDDFAMSQTAGDYPIGEGSVLPLRPNADGTHNNAANILERQNGQDIGVVTAWDLLEEIPMSTTADYVQQVN